MSANRDITAAFEIGGVRIANRVVLAPMAGIGTWFVRLQARRHGAGLVVSEMLSSFGLYHGNRRTLTEFLRIHPDEHPVAVQLFGAEPAVMGRAAEIVARAGADLLDINMGCPVRKVCRSGAGAALLADPDRAVAIARAAARGGGLPVTVKLRSGRTSCDRLGLDLARRLVEEAGVAAVTIHPRPAARQHRGAPDHALGRELAEQLPVPVLATGGLTSAARARAVFHTTGCAAVMLARGAVGNPWLFGEVLGERLAAPGPEEVLAELRWLLERAESHWGTRRGAHRMRQIYPGFLRRLGMQGSSLAAELLETRQVADALAVLDAAQPARAA